MTRTPWMLAAATALAACGTAERGDARAAGASTPAAARADSAAPDTTPGGRKTVVRGTDGFDFVLYRRPTEQVDSVFVTRAGRRLQTLVPSRIEEVTILPDPTWRIDLDFDGHLDFALVTQVPAAPNPAYDYWRYDPAAERFRYVGEYEMFHPDSAGRTLYTHARGGYAGRSWSNSRWRWEKDTVVEFWRNEQVKADHVGERWVYRESELRDGRWVVVKADTMENCEAEPLPDECVGAPAPAPASGVQSTAAR